MRSFTYMRPASLAEAVDLDRQARAVGQSVAYLGGGTSLVDLMKLEVATPARLIDISRAGDDRIEASARGLHLGAGVTMADAAAHPIVMRDYPVIAQSLALAASRPLRAMARLGGNVLQRTRCAYFRDTTWAACNKREPGSGCAAIAGAHRQHAVLGGSDACIATYPGDFAQALIALDATVTLVGEAGARRLALAELHRLPGATPHVETGLRPGECIAGFDIPAGDHTRRSVYLKVRDRQSFAFALASAAVALVMAGDRIDQARIALGGVATRPWRAREAEDYLRGRRLSRDTAAEAGRLAFRGSTPLAQNAFKVQLGAAVVAEALIKAGDLA
jgi:xanthine dehydrogenase YagS FAD-binding subunit